MRLNHWHSAEEMPEDLGLLDNRLTRLAPSKFNSREMKSLQDNRSERILNDRPQCDKYWAPIKLIFSGFGVFHDIVTHKLLPEEYHDWIDDGAFSQALSRYREAASSTYLEEDEKRDVSIKHLNKLYSSLKGRQGRSIESSTVAGESSTTDGHILGPHGAIYFVQALKLELGSGGAVPETQCASYFSRSFNAPRANRVVLQYARVPAVALIAYGSVVQFFGMVMLGTRLRMMPLWHPVDIRIVAGDDMSEEVIWLFKAAIVLDGLIYRELEAIVNNTLSAGITRTTDLHFPAVNEAMRYLDGNPLEVTLKFELRDRFHLKDPDRLLYLALDVNTNSYVFVKFARSYSLELHVYLERKKRAPRLFGFQRLPGGWIVIVMEYLMKFDPLQLQVEDGMAFTSELGGELLALAHETHDQNLVHGDLREANILVPREGMVDELKRPFVIVDFDWGGEIGRAKFPYVPLNPHICVGDKRSRLVQPMDDLGTLMDMIERLQEQSQSRGL